MTNDDQSTRPVPPSASLTADPLVGTVFEGKYQILAKLGEGGMGVVYRAHHVHMDVDVAIKFLHHNLTEDPSILERFKREARAAVRINHPNATTVMDFGVLPDNTAYLVMEYLEGESLRDRIYRHTMTAAEAIEILSETCGAVDAAHKRGVIHRDLKPDNIFLKREADGKEIVKVLDFGIAKLRDKGEASHASLTEAGMLIGTPHYMSPEQCHGLELDPRSDVYSLGVIAYELLAGELPFSAPTSLGIVLKHINEEPRPLFIVNPNIPRELEKVVLRALSKRPDNRPATAGQFARELEAACAGNDVVATANLEGEGVAFHTSMLSSPALVEEDRAETTDAPAIQTSLMSSPLGHAETSDAISVWHTQDGATRETMANRAGPVQIKEKSRTAPREESGTLIASSSSLAKEEAYVPAAAKPQVAEHAGGTLKMGAPNQPGVRVAQAIASPASSSVTSALISSVFSARNVAIGVVAVIALAIGAYVLVPRSGLVNPSGNINSGPPSPPPAPKFVLPENMIEIKGGTFTMGRNSGARTSLDETPSHEVTVKPFAIGKYEVTRKEYADYLVATGTRPPSDWKDGKYEPGTDQFPVVNVSWDDATAYCQWLSQKTGLSYRLPSEAEWEFAARSDDQRLYPWGNTFDPRNANTDTLEVRLPLAVDSIQQAGDTSPFKVMGMAGNVSEWTASDYQLYPNSAAKPDINFGKKQLKILRGGNYSAPKESSTTTCRQWLESTSKDAFLGFRLALDLPQSAK
ncbi:MAG TPA: bifunctional serine/threonine-protein kinase/formylglycine-generating enzyme family protein [Acidobacteriota bacterium]|nr:bifunctional serine/threonine-protein kinase/formylglycine-generating enzyme family protein [Acidobacteriota bacterium]